MPAPSLSRSLALALAGFVLLACTYVAAGAAAFAARPSLWNAAALVLFAASVAFLVAAGHASFRRWQFTGQLPVVLMLYGALGVAALVAALVARGAEGRWLRATPGAHAATLVGNGVDVRDAAGRWHVSFDSCPAARGATGFRSHGDTLEVLDAADRPVLRALVPARRATCLG